MGFFLPKAFLDLVRGLRGPTAARASGRAQRESVGSEPWYAVETRMRKYRRYRAARNAMSKASRRVNR